MSGTLNSLISAGSTASPFIQILLSSRTIGPIVCDLTEEERHEDTLVITRHPIEQGANISDHAYKNPINVVIRARWSDASLEAIASMFTGGDVIGTLTDGAFGSQSYSKQQYQKILALQASCVPFTVVTGKRNIPNMLIASVSEVTNRFTEYALALDITCEQVIIVSTQTTTLPPNASQTTPQNTASPSDSGTQQASPISQDSALKQLTGGSNSTSFSDTVRNLLGFGGGAAAP